MLLLDKVHVYITYYRYKTILASFWRVTVYQTTHPNLYLSWAYLRSYWRDWGTVPTRMEPGAIPQRSNHVELVIPMYVGHLLANTLQL